MKLITFIASLAATAALLAAASAAAASPNPQSPAGLCVESNNADGYLASHGGCVSSVASIGLEELIEGAFPSRAAAVANCKGIAAGGGGWPYAFYGRTEDPRYVADNINECASILEQFHTGQLEPGPAGT